MVENLQRYRRVWRFEQNILTLCLDSHKNILVLTQLFKLASKVFLKVKLC